MDYFKNYISLARWDKPIGSWLLFFPCVWGLFLFPSWHDISFQHLLYSIYFLAGAALMRGAGCVWNDILDRRMDSQVERTRERPLASGEVSVLGAVLFMVFQGVLGLVILVQFPVGVIVVGLASLGLVVLYPLMKRVTYWPQLWLGLTFNWGVWVGGIGGGSGGSDDYFILGLLYVGGVFWTLGYDTVYAMQDRVDDAVVGVKSTALLFGDYVVWWVGGFYVLCHGLFGVVGYLLGGGLFWVFWVLGAGHLGWQVWGLKKGLDYGRLFRSNRDYGFIMLLGYLLI